MVKMTFSLDEITAQTLKRIAKRLQRPQSHILREAISHYEPHAGHLSKAERQRRVALFDQVIGNIPERSASETDAELKALRTSRRKAWQSRSLRNQ